MSSLFFLYNSAIMDAENRSIRSQQSPFSPRKSFGENLREWIKVIIIALAISLPVRFYIAEPFVVNGASMDPTFATGQFLIVDRLTYRFEDPARGDVVIFKYPNNPSLYFIKRIIGLPGETVNINDGVVTITKASDKNYKVVLDEKYIDTAHKSYDTLVSVLGPEQYFVMGDNRDQSSDSRAWGTLDRGLITGRPFVRLLPLTKLSFLPGIHHEYAQTK